MPLDWDFELWTSRSVLELIFNFPTFSLYAEESQDHVLLTIAEEDNTEEILKEADDAPLLSYARWVVWELEEMQNE